MTRTAKNTRQELETNRSRHGGAAKQAVPTAVNDASTRKNAGWKGQGKYLQEKVTAVERGGGPPTTSAPSAPK